MKKLIAIAVVFTLVAGGLFAADLGGTVFGGVRLLQLDTTEKEDDADSIFGGGAMERIRLEGAGENDDGTFGAWLRYDGHNGFGGAGLAWWKPVDLFKMTIGGNPDGIYGKEGYAGWMFYQMPSDCGIVQPASVWGGGYFNPNYGGYGGGPYAPKYRNAFYGGFGGNGLMLDITPADIFAAHIVLPYINMDGDPLKNIFKSVQAQLDFNLDFGNIALTYQGDVGELTPDGDDFKGYGSASRIFLFFNLSAIEILDLSIGVSYAIPITYEEEILGFKIKYTYQAPMAIGLALKVDFTDSVGLKFRTMAQLMEKATAEGYTGNGPFVLGADLLPYFGISDSMKLFIGAGLVLAMPDEGDSELGWHVNPYLQVGQEWGPTFYAGIRVWSDWYAKTGENNDKSYINFAIPIGLQVSF